MKFNWIYYRSTLTKPNHKRNDSTLLGYLRFKKIDWYHKKL